MLRRRHPREPAARLRPLARAGAVALLALAAAPAAAHETLHEVARDRAVAVRALLGDGEVLAGAAYQVYAPADERIPYQQGHTDRHGWLSFVPDAPGAWRVRVTEEAGHGLEVRIPVGADGAFSPAPAPSAAAFVLRPLVGIAVIGAVFAALIIAYRKKRPRA